MPTRLQESTRYIDYEEFDYVIPESINDDILSRAFYRNAMYIISSAIKKMIARGIPREDAAMLLPLGMTTRQGRAMQDKAWRGKARQGLFGGIWHA